jgi:hypothetical protein
MRSDCAPSHRSRPLRALFVHRDTGAIDACLQELQKAQFTVSSDCVLNLAQCAEQLRSQSYDVLIVEYPGSHYKESQVLQLLHQPLQEIALIFLMPGLVSESILELTAEEAKKAFHGAADARGPTASSGIKRFDDRLGQSSASVRGVARGGRSIKANRT